MPQEGPGLRLDATATKETRHGDPAVELNHPGIAAKSAQPEPMAVNLANAQLAQIIEVGEEFVLMMYGQHEVDTDLLPAGAAAGDPLWITKTTNVLVNAATALTGGITEAAYVKFGVIDVIDDTDGRSLVNLNLRDTI